MSSLIDQAHMREWFYAYDLPDGTTTQTYVDSEIKAIHDTRWSMLQSCLDLKFDAGRASASVLDLACHQGWFAVQMCRAGFGHVVGVDARDSHIQDSELIRDIYGLDQLSFRQGDIHDQTAQDPGQFDVVLMLGLLYHLENPVGALRTCRELCKKCCIIETQVVPGMTGYVDYGSYQFVRPLKGSFGIVDETQETHGPEASTAGVCLVPSLDALLWILTAVGFSDVQLLDPPDHAYEQLKYHKRVMVVASV